MYDDHDCVHNCKLIVSALISAVVSYSGLESLPFILGKFCLNHSHTNLFTILMCDAKESTSQLGKRFVQGLFRQYKV